MFQSAGIQLHGTEVDSSGFDTEYIKKQKKRQNASLIYTNPTFHNLTGYVMLTEKRKKLLQVCEDVQLPIIEDDVYRELCLTHHLRSP